MLWESVVLLMFLWITKWVVGNTLKFHRTYSLVNKLPGPPSYFLVGSIWPFVKAPYRKYDKIFKQMMNTLPPSTSISKLWVSALPVVFIHRAEAAEVILKSNTEITKSIFYHLIGEWLGNGLLTSTGKLWHGRRKLLTPSFHFSILNNFVPIFNDKSQHLVAKLKEKSSKYFDIYPYLTLCTLDIICETAMGENINALDNPNSDYIKALNRFNEIFGERLFRPWTLIPAIYRFSQYKEETDSCLQKLHNFTKQVIAKRKQARLLAKLDVKTDISDDINQKEHKVFLETLLDVIDNGQGSLNDEELREEVDTFMFEGHDTTANGLTWAIYYLGKNKKAQQKVHEELDEVFGDDFERPVTMHDLAQLKYLEAAIKEALRLMPSVPIYGRNLTNDLKIGDYTIPAGITVAILANCVHRDPRMYSDPENYIPERHLNERGGERHPFSFVAFSGGPRNCIGQKFAMMEEKIVLANIFRHFYVECKDDIDEMEISFIVVNRPINGLHVVLKSRQK